MIDLGCIRKLIFNGTAISNKIFWKERFSDSAFIFQDIFLQYHEVSTTVGLFENVSNNA